MRGKRSDTPRLSQLMEYWRQHYAEVFTHLAADWIGWGEPFCFRCGWLAPVDDTGPRLSETWDSARGWLEIAHLQDLALGGPNSPDNLVPLCRNCHDMMPECWDRASALAYVAGGAEKGAWWQLHTDTILGNESVSPKYKTKLMRGLYLRCGEIERLLAGVMNGDKRSAEILRDRFPEAESVITDAVRSLSRQPNHSKGSESPWS